MPSSDGTYWTTDEELFLTLQGSAEVAEWFGCPPSFHDAEIERLELATGSGTIVLRAFRTTNEVDAKGFFILDRLALVTVHLDGVTAISLRGDASSIVQEIGIRRVLAEQSGWETVAGPRIGNIELTWESSFGLEGSLYAREVSFSLDPMTM